MNGKHLGAVVGAILSLNTFGCSSDNELPLNTMTINCDVIQTPSYPNSKLSKESMYRGKLVCEDKSHRIMVKSFYDPFSDDLYRNSAIGSTLTLDMNVADNGRYEDIHLTGIDGQKETNGKKVYCQVSIDMVKKRVNLL